MEIRSLEELRQPDERTLAFHPLGLGGRMRPEDAAVFQQEVICHAELVPAVAEGTRNTFDRLRRLHAYGVLFYDAFTIVWDQAHLVVEQALRDRFVEFYGGAVSFEDTSGQMHRVMAGDFSDVYDALHTDGRLRRPARWRLRLQRTGELIYFDGMLDSLIRWARGEGLLRGQRNRQIDPRFKRLRNDVAHGAGYRLLMPVDAARAISDTAEIINQLWGYATPGGRLYPAPIRREIQVIAWGPGAVMIGLAENFPTAEDDDWTYVVVRAVLHDEGLARFDAQYETTTYPCELLWGPGQWQNAAEWLRREQPAADEVEPLDRLFFLQHQEDRLYLPRNPDVAAGLPEDERNGRWYVVRADFAQDAFGHMRQVAAGGSDCSAEGPCRNCAAEILGVGTWQEMVDLARDSGGTVLPRTVPDIRVTSLRGWPRYKDVSPAARAER